MTRYTPAHLVTIDQPPGALSSRLTCICGWVEKAPSWEAEGRAQWHEAHGEVATVRP